MKLGKNVRMKKFPWTVLPLLSTYTAQAIYPNVYLPKDIYLNLLSNKPEHRNVSILIHEQTHIERQGKAGWFLWGFKYCFSPSFRFNEELAAIKTSMRYMKKHGQTCNTDRSAKYLSSYLYLWCISYKEAKKQLDNVWEEI